MENSEPVNNKGDTDEKAKVNPQSEESTNDCKGKKEFKQIVAHGKTKPFEKKILNEYRAFDTKSITVMDRMEQRKEKAPKTFVEREENKKDGIERCLEDSDKTLNELIQLGDELVTNIKIANEKREVMRRNYEALKREELLRDLEKESLEAIAKFDVITSKWTELDILKEPMGLNDGLESQKHQIGELMNQKDEVIRQCQVELKRADAKYYDDLERQSADIYCLVERIDNQMEIMKKSYKSHIELLQETIENERQTLALTAAQKWKEHYNNRAENEKIKTINEKDKATFYTHEIARISLEHEELTRATRIRLERDAESLQLELRNVKNNVLLNSEKLDYNYQVLQKCDDENMIIVNQQKRRLAKLNETVSTLKRKIRDTKYNSQTEIKKLTTEVMQLHTCIVELETKAENFSILGDKKYQAVWEVNLNEATTLLHKVLDVDRILYEQQLGVQWFQSDIAVFKIKDITSRKGREGTKHFFDVSINSDLNSKSSGGKSDASRHKDRRTDEQKLAHRRLLRSILRKIADRGGFFLEDKLDAILKPYSDKPQSLVKIDNIFDALGITKIEDVNSLIQYFVPYSWCPTCSSGLSRSVISKLHLIELKQLQAKDVDSMIYDKISRDPTSKASNSGVRSEKIYDDDVPEVSTEADVEVDENHMDQLMKEFDKKDTTMDRKKSVQFEEKVDEKIVCSNHYLVIEPAFVLTALREFAEKHRVSAIKSKGIYSERSKRKNPLNRSISKMDVETFWHQYANIFPKSKQKIWDSLEHGLNHYLKVLKDRETLDSECEFLRKQNDELMHLLKQYLPPEKCIC